MMKNIDLHIHTTFSDGRCTPAEVIEIVHQEDYNIISFTDHDCIDAHKESLPLKHKFEIEVVPGVEMSTYYDNYELHILGYFIDIFDKELNRILDYHQFKRLERAEKILKELHDLFGFDISINEVFDKATNKNLVGRSHIAAVMFDKGYTNFFNEAFSKYIGNGRPANVKKTTFDAPKVIKTIHEAGGVAIVAHPGVIQNDFILPDLVDKGIDGLEIIYPTHTSNLRKKYLNIAESYDLLVSGGSDFHRPDVKSNKIGVIDLDEKYFTQMKEFARKNY